MSNSNRTNLRLLVAASLLALVVWPTPTPAAPDVKHDGDPVQPICPTEDIWQARRLALGLEAIGQCGVGACDDPLIRDTSPQDSVTVTTVVHVMRSAGGAFPDGVDQAAIDVQMAEMAADFAPYNIQFDYETRFHDDGEFYCIPQFDLITNAWYFAIRDMKEAYAESPATTLNMFVSCQDSSSGELGGIATFPWDPEAATVYGGLWMNSAVVNSGYKVAAHEVGHCLGLWHTHRGDSLPCGDACKELPHDLGDPAADSVGDLCADTPATPVNFACEDPPATATACNGVPWGSIDYRNLMGYALSCADHFTANQQGRMHCWSRSALPDWIGETDCSIPPNPPSDLTATPVTLSRINLAWADFSAFVTSYRIERDSGTGFEEIATVPGAFRSYADTGLDCDADFSYRVRGHNCAGDSEYSATAAASTVCPPGTLMHVESTDVAVGDGHGPWVFGDGTVTILDQHGAPVAGALVYVGWTGSITEKQTGLTDANGVATFATEEIRQSSYCFTMEAQLVKLEGATYYPNANVDTTGEAGTGCGS